MGVDVSDFRPFLVTGQARAGSTSSQGQVNGSPAQIERRRLRRIPSTPACVALTLSAWLVFGSSTLAQQLLPGELSSAEQTVVSGDLATAVAGPREKAFLQILTEASLVRDPVQDTVFVYDLVVRYDPERFHDPHVGIYPVTFADQFILWGKRIALFTRSSTWSSGRFYLHDISTGQHLWMLARDARHLYPPGGDKAFPQATSSDDRAAVNKWFELIHATDTTTDIRSMGLWFRLMHRESREMVIERELARAAAAALPGVGP